MPVPVAYLDHAATTPARPEVLEAMVTVLRDNFGNPSGSHQVSRRARQAVDEAREAVACCLGAKPSEVVFTGGGTEADNLAVFGPLPPEGGAVVASAVEHHAVLHPVERLGGRLVPVDGRGAIDLDALDATLRAMPPPGAMVVSVMLANNEVGTVEPLDAVVDLVRARAPRAVVHTDAVQAFPWLDVAELASGADLVSVSGHKFGGPKGVGALVVRDRVALAPLILGGGQEHERRSGTENVAGIVGLAVAMQLVVEERKAAVERVAARRNRLVDGLLSAVPGLVETVPRAAKVAGSAHVCIEGVESDALLFLLDRAGVCASAGSACASGALEPSHVLSAMGVARPLALGALRLSLGYTTSEADIDAALDAVPRAVAQLRR